MSPWSKILVPVDFSACSRAVLEQAAALGARVGASRIDVLHVWHPPAAVPFEGDWITPLAAFTRSEAGQAMARLLESLEVHDAPPIRGRLATGDPVDAILHLIDAERHDLVVMGCHCRRRFAHLWMGGTVERVTRRAPCPVLIFRAADHPTATHPGLGTTAPTQKGSDHAQVNPRT